MSAIAVREMQFGRTMKRAELERAVEPILEDCLRVFGDLTPKGIAREEFEAYVRGVSLLRPDVRRVSLMVGLACEVLGTDAQGEGLEIGAGYGFLVFPMAKFLPGIRWTGVDHPSRAYVTQEEYLRTYREYGCEFVGLNVLQERLPFPDKHFAVVTFSEVLEHLPVERVNFVLTEIARVVRPGGILLASSPNQASLENRLKLVRGRSILEFPTELESAKGIFGHIRLYTRSEMESAMGKLGFSSLRCVIESNNSAYRKYRGRWWRTWIHRMYELTEGKLGMLRRLGDTWHIAFQKRA
jgi:2-polyprenyl-3-methyl-5-hydroxy-6-metoxy-1,4-benzoquinol methylase